METLVEKHERLNQILKKIQQPGITIDQAKDLYNEGSTISSYLLKNIEGLKRDADSYTIE